MIFILVYSSATKCMGGSMFTDSTDRDIIALLFKYSYLIWDIAQ